MGYFATVGERNAFVAANLNLARKCVHRHANHPTIGPWIRRHGWDEAYQEAYVGLIHAADHWEPSRGKFSTVAYPCVFHAVYRAANECRLVRIPEHEWKNPGHPVAVLADVFVAERSGRVVRKAEPRELRPGERGPAAESRFYLYRAGLSEIELESVRLRYGLEWSYADVAAFLGCGETTASRASKRGIGRLRAKWGKKT